MGYNDDVHASYDDRSILSLPVSVIAVGWELIARGAGKAPSQPGRILLHAAKETVSAAVNRSFHESLDCGIRSAKTFFLVLIASTSQGRGARVVLQQVGSQDSFLFLVDIEDHHFADRKRDVHGAKTNRDVLACHIDAAEHCSVIAIGLLIILLA